MHIPKTGGETIEKVLYMKKNHDLALNRNLCRHDLIADSKIWFTIVRNPYDRLFSWFKFCFHGWRGSIPTPRAFNHCDLVDKEAEANPNMTRIDAQDLFDRWLVSTKTVYDAHNTKDGTTACSQYSNNELHWVWGTFEKWLKSPPGEARLDNLLVHHILYFEDIYKRGKLLQRLCEIGVATNMTVVPHENNDRVGGRHPGSTMTTLFEAYKHYGQWYSSQGKALVYDHYAKDMQWLNYSFREAQGDRKSVHSDTSKYVSHVLIYHFLSCGC